ncbi:MAG: hypothetical protein U5K72_06710 [Balneolaceae bacterium]|nr:hypothetical protein [Balneolaceae bacterium]
MDKEDLQSLKVDRKVLQVDSLKDESNDKTYWHSRTPQERLKHMERLRRINYGDDAAGRLQRVFEVIQRS